MDVDNKKMYSFSIVLLGNFSPLMFQPYWFKQFGILDNDEFNSIESYKNALITNGCTIFETDNLSFQITETRLQILAKKEPFELLIDVFSKMQEKLGAVLVEKFGMNYSFHINLETSKNMKKFGDVLAPKDYWTSFFDDTTDNKAHNGLAALVMTKETDFGQINLQIETSGVFFNHVFFSYNFHFIKQNDDRHNDNNLFDIMDVNDIINQKHQEFMSFSNHIAKQLIESVFNYE